MNACFSLSVSAEKNARLFTTGISLTSAMDLPPTVTASASRLSLRPPQSGQGDSLMYAPSSSFIIEEFVSRKRRSRFGMMPSNGDVNVPLRPLSFS